MSKSANLVKRTYLAAAVAALLVTWTGAAAGPDDPLARGFLDPPDGARPRVWWHWMNGNVTQEGIRADLAWMKRAGIAGFQNFDAGLETPQVVGKRLVFMTPEWKEAFKTAATLADQLGLEMAIAGSPGWSESGGPWVTPAQAMKKYVWSETRLEGGRPFSGKLPKPPSTTGAYQNEGGRHEGYMEGSKAAPPEFYADSAVVAYRAPAERPDPGRARGQGHLERRDVRRGRAHRRRPLPDIAPAGRGAGPKGLGPVRIRLARDLPRADRERGVRRSLGRRRDRARVERRRDGL